jgi:uncharacterized membrane protein
MKKLMITIVLMLASVSQALVACPACKDSFGANGANASAGDAYSWSVLFMLSVPITILIVFIVFLARKIKQNPNSAPTM